MSPAWAGDVRTVSIDERLSLDGALSIRSAKKRPAHCWAVRDKFETSCLQPAKQKKDQQDHDHQTEAAAAIIAGAVKRTAADAAKATKQSDNQDD
jgi:hypothetical protein